MKIYIDIEKKLNNFLLNTSFDVEADNIGILGSSGSGKSLTLKSISGIVSPDKGIININDRLLFDSNKKIDLKPQKREIGYMPQSYALFPKMTVEENIRIVIKGNSVYKKNKVSDLISIFSLNDVYNKYPSQLSGGQQQRTALARIIAAQPDVIMLDEAFSALDTYLKDSLQQEVSDFLKQYNIPAIIVSHDKNEIYKMSNYILIMSQGKIIEQGKPMEIYENPQNIDTAKLLGYKNISPVKMLSNNEAYATDWGLTLKLSQAIPTGIKYICIKESALTNIASPNKINYSHINKTNHPFGTNVKIYINNVHRPISFYFNFIDLSKAVYISSEGIVLLK